MANSLTYFTCSGYFYTTASAPLGGSTNTGQSLPLSGTVSLRPRFPSGFQVWVDDYDLAGDGSQVRDTAIAFPQINAVVLGGRLGTHDVANAVDIKLASNSAILGLAALGRDFIYDVAFDLVDADGESVTLENFAFEAPVDTSAVSLTRPTLNRLPYLAPSQVT